MHDTRYIILYTRYVTNDTILHASHSHSHSHSSHSPNLRTHTHSHGHTFNDDRRFSTPVPEMTDGTRSERKHRRTNTKQSDSFSNYHMTRTTMRHEHAMQRQSKRMQCLTEVRSTCALVCVVSLLSLDFAASILQSTMGHKTSSTRRTMARRHNTMRH